MARTPFPIIPALCAVAIGYKNNAMIADSVLPLVTVGQREFYYLDFRSVDIFTVPELEVGRKTAPNEVEFGATRLLAAVKDFALKDRIPMADIDAAAKAPYPYDPEARSAEALMEILKLGREIRTSRLVFNPATYTKNELKVVLDDKSNYALPDVDAVDQISEMLDKPLQRPNKMVLGQSAWTTLRKNPSIVKSITKGFAGDKGLISRQEFCDLFEIEELIVGSGWYNVAKKGQKAQRVRVWGGHLAAIYQPSKIISPEGNACFGYTASYGLPWGGSQYDKDIGPEGGQEVRVGHKLKEMVVGDEFGFFIGNVTGKDPI